MKSYWDVVTKKVVCHYRNNPEKHACTKTFLIDNRMLIVHINKKSINATWHDFDELPNDINLNDVWLEAGRE